MRAMALARSNIIDRHKRNSGVREVPSTRCDIPFVVGDRHERYSLVSAPNNMNSQDKEIPDWLEKEEIPQNTSRESAQRGKKELPLILNAPSEQSLEIVVEGRSHPAISTWHCIQDLYVLQI